MSIEVQLLGKDYQVKLTNKAGLLIQSIASNFPNENIAQYFAQQAVKDSNLAIKIDQIASEMLGEDIVENELSIINIGSINWAKTRMSLIVTLISKLNEARVYDEQENDELETTE